MPVVNFNLVTNVFYLIIIFSLTTLIGFSFGNKTKSKNNSTKILLAYSAGVGLIGFGGMLASIFGVSIFNFQFLIAGVLLLKIFLIIKKHGFQINASFIKEDWVILVIGVTTTFAFILFFSNIIIYTWAGDGAFHSSVIRSILEGEKIPIKFIPSGGDYSNYPKLFHFYSYFFVKMLGEDIVVVIKLIPIIIVQLTSLGIYALTREIGLNKTISSLAFVTSFAVWKHNYPLIWMGYPQLTAYLIILAIIVALLLDKPDKIPYTGIFLIFTLYFIHQRHFLYVIPIVVWVVTREYLNFSKIKASLLSLSSIMLSVIAIWLLKQKITIKFPLYLTWIINTPTLRAQQAYLWNIGLLGIIGFFVFSFKSKKIYELPTIMLFSWFLIGALLDSCILCLQTLGDNRMYSILYIPLAIFSALLIEGIINQIKLKKTFYYVYSINAFLIFSLLLSTTFINTTTRLSWAMDADDYQLMTSLKGKRGITVNLDPTGKWIYPITGMEVTNPIGRPHILNNSQIETIIKNPTSQETIRIFDSLQKEYGNVYVFISTISVKRPGYWLFTEGYPKIKIDAFTSDIYETVNNGGESILLKYRS